MIKKIKIDVTISIKGFKTKNKYQQTEGEGERKKERTTDDRLEDDPYDNCRRHQTSFFKTRTSKTKEWEKQRYVTNCEFSFSSSVYLRNFSTGITNCSSQIMCLRKRVDFLKESWSVV